MVKTACTRERQGSDAVAAFGVAGGAMPAGSSTGPPPTLRAVQGETDLRGHLVARALAQY